MSEDRGVARPPALWCRRAAAAALCALILSASATSTSPQGAPPDASLSAARRALTAGRYADAEALAGTLFAALDTSAGHDQPGAAAVTNLFIESLVRNGRGAEARTRAIVERAQRRGAQAWDEGAQADTLRHLADVLVASGEYGAALDAALRAQAMRARQSGAPGAAVAEDLDRVARARLLLDQYDQATTVAEQALALKRAASPRDARAVSQTLELRAILHQRQRQYDRARAVLAEVVALREAEQPDHPAVAEALRLTADVCWVDGDLKQSQQLAARALAMAERLLRPDHPDLSLFLKSLALATQDLGDPSAALAYRERAVALAERALGPDHPVVANQLNDLAISLDRQAEYSRARPLLERTLTMYERRVGPNHSSVATAVYNLAYINALLGNFLDARRYFLRVTAMLTRPPASNPLLLGYVLAAHADMLAEQRRDAEAIALYRRALTLREATNGRDHPLVAETLDQAATVLARLGRIDEAHAMSTRALAIHVRTGGSETPKAAGALRVQASIDARRGDTVGALRHYDTALHILRRVLGDRHPDVAVVAAAMAPVLARTGRTADAIRAALDAEAIGRAHLRLTVGYLPERQALGYAARRPKGLDLALSFGGGDPQVAPRLFEEVVQGRSLVLDEMAVRQRGAIDPSRPELGPLWQAVRAARQRLANLVVRGATPGQEGRHQALVDEARDESERAERALSERSLVFRQVEARAAVGLDEVRAALAPGTALVSYVHYERSAVPSGASGAAPAAARATVEPRPTATYAAFVLRGGETEPVLVPLASARRVDTLVSAWRRDIALGAIDAPPSALGAHRTSGAALRRQVWDPIAARLEGVRRVFVVPDGALNLVPLAALPIGARAYLIERGPVIHYLSAERDVVVEDSAARRTGVGLLSLGGPAFNDASVRRPMTAAPSSGPRPGGRGPVPSSPPPEGAGSATLRGARSPCATIQQLQFAALPASGREATAVARLWQKFARVDPDTAPRLLAGREASERALKASAPGHRVLHLATHGFFLGPDCVAGPSGSRGAGGLATKTRAPLETGSPLLLSGLAFAGANRRATAAPDDEDGILTAEEVSSLDLGGVEWAVLSACDTGVGEVKVGEGVFGLRRAFRVAGARTVIMSLWAVEDRAALAWMRALYEGRFKNNLDTADAVAAASQRVLAARRARGESTHPFFWAGFVAAGDWR